MSLASSTSPLGMQKTLSNSRPVVMKAFLSLSFWILTLEVAPLSAMEDSFFEFVDVVDLFIVVIVLLIDPASGRDTIV